MPWRKVDTLALSLLRKMLDPNPKKRLVLRLIVEHKWCNMMYENSGMVDILDLRAVFSLRVD